MFADDTAILASSWKIKQATKYIQPHLDELMKFYIKWKIKINPEKTELVIFTRKKKRNDEPSPIFIDNIEVKPVKKAKYLGVIADNKLNFTAHLQHVVKKARITIQNLRRLISRQSKTTLKNKILLYKMIIKPIMLYAASIWGNTCKTNIATLETIQNKILRNIKSADRTTTNEEIRSSLKIPTLLTSTKTLTRNFYNDQVENIDILSDLGKINRETAPFRIRYKLPHQLLIEDS